MEVKVAVVQDSPAIFDLENTLEKVEKLTKEAASEGAKLILFPEAFVSSYPKSLKFGTVVGNRTEEGREVWLKYVKSSVQVPGPATDRLASIAAGNSIYLVIGVIERDTISNGTLYCTILYFSPAGKLLGKHRKLKPTAGERMVWGEGSGDTLSTFDTSIGKIGGLICWENYMPLARMAMYNKGVEIYLAPTADHRDTWVASMQHIAREGRCFVLSCNQFVKATDYPEDILHLEGIKELPDIVTTGGSVIVSPLGKIIAGPLFNEAGILYATLDLEDIIRSKLEFDVIGHYSRDDVFNFDVPSQPDTVKE
ncbi:unnamed protein product [Dimorphilus gyrociliatus]|uniref:CN hydrolase domain-containing protein n=1 Tax=Dimorphilus gyrociliatus TaxID=2664684 RepID=A0A7I8VWQ8_9ANNE|nr:unnamed protein product [Dimorphilus gyrociliatus]